MTCRTVLAGLGNRGGMWARLLAEDPGTAIAAVVDPDPARIAAFEADHGPRPAFPDLAAALAAVAADAVVLATPPAGHEAQARAAFAAGVPLMAEKPLATDLGAARRIVAAAAAADVPLSVGLNFRYLPVTRAYRGILARGDLGAPGFGSFAYLRNRDWWRPGMNAYPREMDHPMMLEQSVHHLDLIRHVYGREVVSLSCRTWNPPWSVYRGDANVACQLALEGGVEVVYTGTWTGGWNEMAFEWRTDCAGGVVLQRALFSDLATAGTEDAAPTPVPLARCEPFLDDTRALWSDFRRALASAGPLPCPGRDHLETLAVCFAALESHATGRRVAMAEFRSRHGIARP